MLAEEHGLRLFLAFLAGVLFWVIGSVVLVVLGLGADSNPPIWQTNMFLLVLWIGQLSVCYIWQPKNWVKGYSLEVKKWDTPIGLGVGALLQFPILPLLYLPFYFLIDRGDISGAAEELAGSASGVGWKIFFVFFVVVLTPIVEEIFFRGFLQSVLHRYIPYRHLVVILVAIIFTLGHYSASSGWWPLLGLSVAALVFGYTVLKTGRLRLSIFIHMGFNWVAFILVSV